MPKPESSTRRDFLKTSTVAAAGASLAGSLSIARSAHASVDDTLRVGLIGCGGRGTGAAGQALNADKNVKLVAMGDAFPDRLEASLRGLRNEQGSKVDVPPERRFHGFDAYKGVLGAGVDVVILTTPPHFRPMQLKAAIEAGKHVFCEKPVAVDAQGVRSVLETAELAKKKDLTIVSGLCWRYDPPKRDDGQTSSRRRDRRRDGHAQHVSHRHALATPAQARVERNGVSGAQLALFHLAIGRSHYRAACA